MKQIGKSYSGTPLRALRGLVRSLTMALLALLSMTFTSYTIR